MWCRRELHRMGCAAVSREYYWHDFVSLFGEQTVEKRPQLDDIVNSSGGLLEHTAKGIQIE